MSDFDSIVVIRPGVNDLLYRFSYRGDQEIQYEKIKRSLVHYMIVPRSEAIGKEIFTTITGFELSTTTDVNWKISSMVKCADMLPDWAVELFCEGRIEENKVRVTDDNRSKSVETTEMSILNWGKGASGILLENTDTIGFFSIVINPCEHGLSDPWCKEFFPEYQSNKINKSKTKVSVSWRPDPGIDYCIDGRVRGRNFIMLRNGSSRKIWIITDNIQRCMFQSDLNYPGISKKYRILPYFLLGTNITDQDRSEIFRLAMVGKILDYSIDNNMLIN